MSKLLNATSPVNRQPHPIIREVDCGLVDDPDRKVTLC
jgi:hypothetical protein